MTCGILVPQPDIKLGPMTVKADKHFLLLLWGDRGSLSGNPSITISPFSQINAPLLLTQCKPCILLYKNFHLVTTSSEPNSPLSRPCPLSKQRGCFTCIPNTVPGTVDAGCLETDHRQPETWIFTWVGKHVKNSSQGFLTFLTAGTVLWKTIFPWTGLGGWFGEDSSALHLLDTWFLLLLHGDI